MTRATAYEGAPINLYEIVYGDNPENVFRFTNHTQDVVLDEETYVAEPVKHDNIKDQGRPKNEQLKITMSRKSALSEHLRGTPPRRVLRVRVLEAEVNNGIPTAVIPIWHGRLTGTEPKGKEVIFTCAPAGSRMKMPALTRTYSRQCSVPLFSDMCGANKAAATVATTVAAIPGFNVVTLATGWQGALNAQDFLGGTFEWTSDVGTEVRAVVSIDADTLVLDGPTDALAVADSVSVVLGCPRTLAACRDLHDNVNNFGGCPYIPYENIVNKSMI